MAERKRKLRPRPHQTSGQTKLARARLDARLTQEQMSEMTGIPLRTYRRLESGQVENPPIRHLANCAIALNVPLLDVVDDEWLEWMPFDQAAAPDPPLRSRGRRSAKP